MQFFMRNTMVGGSTLVWIVRETQGMDPEGPNTSTNTYIYTNAETDSDTHSDADTDPKKIYVINPIFNVPQGTRMLEKSSWTQE